VGVDGVTKEQYDKNLTENLQELHARMKSNRYRHQPIRRVQIPKGRGKRRPIGISALEDKIVQGAIRQVLEAVYEQDFVDGSYGFRPGRNAHDALRVLDRAAFQGEVNWVLEADIVSFFDCVNHATLKELLRIRIADGSLHRLIGKCLNAGVLEQGVLSTPDAGTAQGSVLSPILANIYLHYILDQWFESEVKPRLRGVAHLIRYADDFVITFQHEDDARRVMAVLGKRMAKYGLTLHPDKTRLLRFGRPPRTKSDGKGPATFDFLGFTAYWRRTQSGRWQMTFKTRRGRLARAISAVHDWCRRHRHMSLQAQHTALTRRLQGHFNYFGVQGNRRSLAALYHNARRSWFFWLRRRSQRAPLTWERFVHTLRTYPLPQPRIKVQIWAT
jgi:group II intron reverse transcriptase/maturase